MDLKYQMYLFFRVLRDDPDCVFLAIKKKIGVGHTSKDTMGSHFEIRAHTPSIWQVCMDALINY
tara:strand:- start:194 stop:385 length:192 start_codon:yes stop_codon:yes gene_type:complete